MIFKKYKKVSASYFDKFCCSNSNCEFTCCGGWIVAIDKHKYKMVEDAIVKNGIGTQGLLSMEKDAINKKSFGKLNLRNRLCPLLTKQYLCSLQKKNGNKGIPVACATFPRIFNRINNMIFVSARLSCIEVARMVLLDKQGLEIVFKQSDSLDLDENFEIAVNIEARKNEGSYFNDLVVDFLFSLLKIENVDIVTKVKYVILFARELALLNGNVGKRDLKKIFKGVKDLMDKSEGINLKEDVNFQHDFILGNIVPEHIAIIEELNVDGRYKKLYEVLKANEKIHTKEYRFKLQKFNDCYMYKYGYILRNFLLNFILNEIFPFKSGNIRYETFRFVINFSILKFLFILDVENSVAEDLVQIIFQYSRIFGNVEIPKLRQSFFTNSDEVFDLLWIIC